MFVGHYDEWRQARMRGLKKHIPDTYFQGKTVHEMGCGYGHVANLFSEKGATVSCSDARSAHIEKVKELFPHLQTQVLDVTTDKLESSYDVIIHWGLLYHLPEIETPIANLADKCNVLLLETEIADSDDDSYFLSLNESGYDQAINDKGIRPSPAYVEKVLRANGFQCQMILDSELNCQDHVYDLPIENSGGWRNGFRRFWICWKDGHSPL